MTVTADKEGKAPRRRHREKVGDYIIGKTIGEGTFGKVKLGVHAITGEEVAVKILKRARLTDKEDINRVKREIEILRNSNNPNVIQLLEVIETSAAIYLVMEHADGGEIFDYIVEKEVIEEEEAQWLFRQILSGVLYLHQMDIAHRDLKPENLLLQSSNDRWLVKIVDFGLSAPNVKNRLLSTPCGSPCYAAPETIRGEEYSGEKVDVWAMGVVLYALVCGYLPFEEESVPEMYEKICAGEYDPPEHTSEACQSLISGMLNTDPGARLTLEAIYNHQWCTTDKTELPQAPSVSSTPDQAVVEALPSLGVDCSELANHLRECQLNRATTSYHLLLHRKRRMEDYGESVCSATALVSHATLKRESCEIPEASEGGETCEEVPHDGKPHTDGLSMGRQSEAAANNDKIETEEGAQSTRQAESVVPQAESKDIVAHPLADVGGDVVAGDKINEAAEKYTKEKSSGGDAAATMQGEEKERRREVQQKQKDQNNPQSQPRGEQANVVRSTAQTNTNVVRTGANKEANAGERQEKRVGEQREALRKTDGGEFTIGFAPAREKISRTKPNTASHNPGATTSVSVDSSTTSNINSKASAPVRNNSKKQSSPLPFFSSSASTDEGEEDSQENARGHSKARAGPTPLGSNQERSQDSPRQPRHTQSNTHRRGGKNARRKKKGAARRGAAVRQTAKTTAAPEELLAKASQALRGLKATVTQLGAFRLDVKFDNSLRISGKVLKVGDEKGALVLQLKKREGDDVHFESVCNQCLPLLT